MSGTGFNNAFYSANNNFGQRLMQQGGQQDQTGGQNPPQNAQPQVATQQQNQQSRSEGLGFHQPNLNAGQNQQGAISYPGQYGVPHGTGPTQNVGQQGGQQGGQYHQPPPPPSSGVSIDYGQLAESISNAVTLAMKEALPPLFSEAFAKASIQNLQLPPGALWPNQRICFEKI